MEAIRTDPKLIARCGLYCGACARYLKGSCPGCEQNTKATWCKVRSCCNAAGFATCANCKSTSNVRDCSKFNNFISKLFGLVFNSDRAACIEKIREIGLEEYAVYMASRGCPSLPRRKAKSP